MIDELGDRQKSYERRESDRRFMPQVPICARLDGKNFSRFTRGLERPFDSLFSRLMIDTTVYLVKETNACIGYTQSDEISLIYYSDSAKSQIFFDGRIQKMNSVLASMATVKFNQYILNMIAMMNETMTLTPVSCGVTEEKYQLWNKKIALCPIFDCRVWMVPNKVEAVNCLKWRELDATKNSITMASREYYSDKKLFKKNSSEKQEMLFKKNINWNDYPSFFKRGTYIQRRKVARKFTADELDNLPEKHEARKNPDLTVERTDVNRIEMPPIAQVVNRVEVVFNGADPITEKSS